MIQELIKQAKIAIIMLIILTCITGIIYPALVTLFAQLFFPWKANGSLIELNGKTIGSVLIGQSFTDPNYFWGRPSATESYPYNASHSSGSNMGPSNPAFILAIKNRTFQLLQNNYAFIPIELVTSSASGLDPHISPEAAYFQVSRIAKQTRIPENRLKDLINKSIENQLFGFLGEPCINVLKLNLQLDQLRTTRDKIPTQS